MPARTRHGVIRHYDEASIIFIESRIRGSGAFHVLVLSEESPQVLTRFTETIC